jgi:hypothetical protein
MILPHRKQVARASCESGNPGAARRQYSGTARRWLPGTVAIPRPTLVIPAKAGIQCVIQNVAKLKKDLDSRFRGNDKLAGAPLKVVPLGRATGESGNPGTARRQHSGTARRQYSGTARRWLPGTVAIPRPTLVIPAKAGIQCVIQNVAKLEKDLDSRFRGNDKPPSRLRGNDKPPSRLRGNDKPPSRLRGNDKLPGALLELVPLGARPLFQQPVRGRRPT